MINEVELEKAFGQVIKDMRKEHGLSQDQLAEYSNISRQAISAFETYQRKPTLYTIFCIAEGLKISPDELVQRVHEAYKELNK